MNSSFDFLGGQSAPRASDGVGIRLLYRCNVCQRIWLQDGKRVVPELDDRQLQELSHTLQAPLDRLPASTCRLCLLRAGHGAIEMDEYGQGMGFGFSWECPQPHLVHAMLTILSPRWLARQSDPAGSLPDVVRHPQKMRAVLTWLTQCPCPRQYHVLERPMLQALATTNPPGFGQPGTGQWQWKGSRFSALCPPLGGHALLLLAVAMPATEPFCFPAQFPLWQSLAHLALLGKIAGETPPFSSPEDGPFSAN